MTNQIHWAHPVNGDFSNAGDWSGGVVPGYRDDALLDATGAQFTVTSSAYLAVNGIDLVTGATLNFTAGASFNALNGTDGGANAGVILIGAGATFQAGGTIDNRGTINLSSTSSRASFVASILGVSLTGGGQIIMNDNPLNRLSGKAFEFGSLTNVDNTISGAGVIGDGGGDLFLTNLATGTIDANGSNQLAVVDFAGLNAGLIENTGSGGLLLSGGLTNSGTIINTGVGALTLSDVTIDKSASGVLSQGVSLLLRDGTVLGGTMTIAAGQSVTAEANYGGELGTYTLLNHGTVTVQDGAYLFLGGTVTNAGAISVQGAVKATTLRLGVVLNGGGSIIMSDNANNKIIGNITNIDNTISGSGNIGSADMNWTNQAAGVIDANGINPMSVYNGLSPLVNAGLIEATGRGGLMFSSSPIHGTGGQILAAANSAIRMASTTIQGGGLTLDTGSVLTGNGYLYLSTLTDHGSITAVGGAFAFKGAGDTFAGALAGTEIDFAGVETLDPGSSLTAATVRLISGASVQIRTNLTFTGIWRQAGASVTLQARDLSLGGTGSTISGLIGGTGTLSFLSGVQTLIAGAVLQVPDWSIGGGAVVAVKENLSFSGALRSTSGTILAIAAGDALNLSGIGSTLAGSVNGGGILAFSGGVTTLEAGATLTVTQVSLLAGAIGLAESLTYAGLLEQATGAQFLLGPNTLTLTGAGSTFAGVVTGAGGHLVLAGGSQTFALGASVRVSDWSIQGGASAVFSENLAYAGDFGLASGSAAVAKGHIISLSGVSTFGSGALIDGAGALIVRTASLAGLTLGGTATLEVVGTLDQTGAVTLGDTTSSAALCEIGKTGTWRLDADVGIGRGTSTATKIIDAGLLIKAGGTGTSVVAVGVADSGSIEVASGTLDFTQTVIGAGRLTIDAGATLRLDATASFTLTLAFNGAGATLALGQAGLFHVAMSGFSTGDVIDLLGLVATSATLGAGDRLVVANGARMVATLQLAGSYLGDTFSVASDGYGGSKLSLVPPASGAFPLSATVRPAAFVQQMSAMGAAAAIGVIMPPHGEIVTRLSLPGAGISEPR